MSVKEFLLFSIMLNTDASERNYMYFKHIRCRYCTIRIVVWELLEFPAMVDDLCGCISKSVHKRF